MLTQSQRRGGNTRQEITQAAHDLFVNQRYHGTSMRQITQKAGIALGCVYNHFDGKEEVFLAFHPYQEILPALITAHSDDVEQFVRGAFHQSLTALEHRPDFMNLMFIELKAYIFMNCFYR